ncbi:MAG: YqgE/AlgH family protein [Desulfobulbus sp.]|jgi:putative transcriptional regulator
MNNLTGHFLISTPQMPDPMFREQVIFLCAHNTEGAMGLVINNPNPTITLLDIFHNASLPLPEGPMPPVYMGGPVEMEAGFVLHSGSSSEKSYSAEICPGIFVSRDMRLLEDISRGEGPRDFLFLLGYAGWGEGQLERELMDNSWLVVPVDPEVLFHAPDEEKWRKSARRFGIDIASFGNVIGTA